MSATPAPVITEPAHTTRQYDSPIRRQQAAETRDRIVIAGTELLKHSSVRDWRALTIRAVAKQAGVNERTVYRNFTNERGLRDAVMHRLEQQAGIDLAGMRLEDIADVTSMIFTEVSSHPLQSRPPLDPTLTDAYRRQQQALREALAACTSQWRSADRDAAAGMLDVLWSVASFERLVVDWQLDRDQAIKTITWAIGLIEAAVRRGERPSSGPAADGSAASNE